MQRPSKVQMRSSVGAETLMATVLAATANFDLDAPRLGAVHPLRDGRRAVAAVDIHRVA